VVVSSVRALAEIVQDGETGLLFPPLDAGALADQLGQLLDNPELRRKLGARAREWVARDRTWAHNAARYREIYNSVLSQGDDPVALLVPVSAWWLLWGWSPQSGSGRIGPRLRWGVTPARRSFK
jgi:hypothetical protein